MFTCRKRLDKSTSRTPIQIDCWYDSAGMTSTPRLCSDPTASMMIQAYNATRSANMTITSRISPKTLRTLFADFISFLPNQAQNNKGDLRPSYITLSKRLIYIIKRKKCQYFLVKRLLVTGVELFL